MKKKETLTLQYFQEDFDEIVKSISEMQSCIDNKKPITQKQVDILRSFFINEAEMADAELKNIREEIMERFGQNKIYDFTVPYKSTIEKFPLPNSGKTLTQDKTEIRYFNFENLIEHVIHCISFWFMYVPKNESAIKKKHGFSRYVYTTIENHLKKHSAEKKMGHHSICTITGFLCWRMGIAISPDIRNSIREKQKIPNSYFAPLVDYIASKQPKNPSTKKG